MSPLRLHRTAQLSFLLMLFFISGCLPTACQRRESREMFPSDSLSRKIAESTPVDTLSLIWETNGNIDQPLQYPRTVRFGEGDKIYASDVQGNKIYEFLSSSGVLNRTYDSPAFSFPYLAGIDGDTLMVFNPDAQRIDFMYEGRSVYQISTPPDVPENQRLQYVSIQDDNIYYKVIGEDFDGYIAKLDRSGAVLQKTMLKGPLWRHAGMLRAWGDSLISLCAYRPVLDIISKGNRLDTLLLSGFDSPMLPRSRAFVLGEIPEPPLLSPSATIVGDMLFALNLRPGWLRVDQFNRQGKLEKRLVQDAPSFSKAFYPIDLDARIVADSLQNQTVELAILYVEPEPRLALYRFGI